MDIGEQDRSGRHRLADGAAIWLPFDGEADHPPADARPLPTQRTRDPYFDTDAVGLRKFNIGLVPASVTPPRTWKHAAWFAVLSSAGVLVGLAIVAAEFVGSGPLERIGLPGYPTGGPIVTGFDGTTTPPPPPPKQSRPPSSVATTGTSAGRGADAVRPTGVERVSGGGTAESRESAVPSPQVVVVSNTAEPLVDGNAMAMLTEEFYEQVARNADTAMAMVTDDFRADAGALLERRFADVSRIQVTAISVDPTSGVTVSTLQVTREDGSTTTEKRELVFTTAGDLLIDAERPAGGA